MFCNVHYNPFCLTKNQIDTKKKSDVWTCNIIKHQIRLITRRLKFYYRKSLQNRSLMLWGVNFMSPTHLRSCMLENLVGMPQSNCGLLFSWKPTCLMRALQSSLRACEQSKICVSWVFSFFWLVNFQSPTQKKIMYVRESS